MHISAPKRQTSFWVLAGRLQIAFGLGHVAWGAEPHVSRHLRDSATRKAGTLGRSFIPEIFLEFIGMSLHVAVLLVTPARIDSADLAVKGGSCARGSSAGSSKTTLGHTLRWSLEDPVLSCHAVVSETGLALSDARNRPSTGDRFSGDS